jgi:hypothetical protein
VPLGAFGGRQRPYHPEERDMKKCSVFVLAGLVCLLPACSSGDNNHQQGNVFSEQIHDIDKAKQANKLMLEKAKEQKKAIDNIDQ